MFQTNASIQPRGVYSPQYTRQTGNMARALGTSTLHDLYRGRSQEGVSTASPMSQYGMGLDASRQMAQASAAPAQIGLQHALTNAQSLLQGQQARDQEALQWGQLGGQNWANQLQNQLALQQGLLGLLRGFGGWGG